MAREKAEFTGSQGETLAGRLDLPEGAPKAYILFAHCFTCGKDLSTVNRLARYLNELGYALFRFDFTGLGASYGDFANTNFSSNVEDLIAAANWLEAEREAPGMLIGHSLGGAAVLAAAAQIPSAKAVATIGAPYDVAHVLENFSGDITEIESSDSAKVSLQGRPFTIKKQFVEDVREQSMHQHIAQLGRALLIFHSPTDQTVAIENARQIYDAAKHPKSFVTLDGADHLLMEREEDGKYVARILAAYAERYL